MPQFPCLCSEEISVPAARRDTWWRATARVHRRWSSLLGCCRWRPSSHTCGWASGESFGSRVVVERTCRKLLSVTATSLYRSRWLVCVRRASFPASLSTPNISNHLSILPTLEQKHPSHCFTLYYFNYACMKEGFFFFWHFQFLQWTDGGGRWVLGSGQLKRWRQCRGPPVPRLHPPSPDADRCGLVESASRTRKAEISRNLLPDSLIYSADLFVYSLSGITLLALILLYEMCRCLIGQVFLCSLCLSNDIYCSLDFGLCNQLKIFRNSLSWWLLGWFWIYNLVR